MTAVRRLLTVALTTALLGALTACDAEPERSAPQSSDGPNVIRPGAPGEPATTIAPDSVSRSEEWNHTDVAFMQMMIPHHAQAVQMAELAKTRASDARVRTLAERIRAAQAPEILAMAAWLDERSMDVPRAGDDPMEYDHGQHGHNSMMGMLTEVQMDRLGAARGPEFDRLFLRGMIRHHAGAVDMAEQAAGVGTDVIVEEMTADVATIQSAEISRMRDLLSTL